MEGRAENLLQNTNVTNNYQADRLKSSAGRDRTKGVVANGNHHTGSAAIATANLVLQVPPNRTQSRQGADPELPTGDASQKYFSAQRASLDRGRASYKQFTPSRESNRSPRESDTGFGKGNPISGTTKPILAPRTGQNVAVADIVNGPQGVTFSQKNNLQNILGAHSGTDGEGNILLSNDMLLDSNQNHPMILDGSFSKEVDSINKDADGISRQKSFNESSRRSRQAMMGQMILNEPL